MFNPVFHFEAIRTARRDHHHALRVAYGLVLLLYLAGEYAAWDVEVQGHSIRWLGRFARATFARLAILQDLAIVALVPALTAGVIAAEVRRRTLPGLLASRLSEAEIVLGKLGVRLLHLTSFMVIGLPAVALLGLIGGLEPALVVAVYADSAALTLFASGLSILLSTLLRRPRAAIAASYAALAAWMIAPWMLGSLVGRPGWPFGATGLLPGSALRFSPILAWLRLWVIAENSAIPDANPALTTWLFRGLRADSPWLIGVHSVLGVACLAMAVAALRGDPSSRGWWRRERAAAALPPCGDAPMLWKERYAAGTGPWLRRAGWVVGGLLLISMAYDLVRCVALAFRIRSEIGSFPAHVLSTGFCDVLRPAHTALFAVWVLTVAGAAAVGVTGEREAETWDALRTTPLGGREIVLAKQLGAAWGARGLFGALLIVWTLGLAAGALHPLGVLAAWLGLVVFSWFAAALGTAVSLRARDSSRALVTTASVLLSTTLGCFLSSPFSGTAREGGRIDDFGREWAAVIVWIDQFDRLGGGEFGLGEMQDSHLGLVHDVLGPRPRTVQVPTRSMHVRVSLEALDGLSTPLTLQQGRDTATAGDPVEDFLAKAHPAFHESQHRNRVRTD